MILFLEDRMKENGQKSKRQMRRNKIFWSKLTPEERFRLWHYEREQNMYGFMGGYLPDDSSECMSCGNPMLGAGQCVKCLDDFIAIVNKAEGK